MPAELHNRPAAGGQKRRDSAQAFEPARLGPAAVIGSPSGGQEAVEEAPVEQSTRRKRRPMQGLVGEHEVEAALQAGRRPAEIAADELEAAGRAPRLRERFVAAIHPCDARPRQRGRQLRGQRAWAAAEVEGALAPRLPDDQVVDEPPADAPLRARVARVAAAHREAHRGRIITPRNLPLSLLLASIKMEDTPAMESALR